MKKLIWVGLIFLLSCNKDKDVKPKFKFDFSKLLGKLWKTGIRQRIPDGSMEFFKGDSGVYHRMIAAYQSGVQYADEKFTWHPIKPDTIYFNFGGAVYKYPVLELNDTIVKFDNTSYVLVYSTL